jgi:hypothetical protein
MYLDMAEQFVEALCYEYNPEAGRFDSRSG